MNRPVRTRFCLVPGVSLHTEAARVALVNWLVARRADGQFLLRVGEDSRSGVREPDEERGLEDLRWLGLDWDGGLHRHGEHVGIYEPYYKILIKREAAYFTFDTPQEMKRMRQEALAGWRVFRYPRPLRFAAEDEIEQARRQGRPIVLRLKMPSGDMTIEDQVLGPVTIPAEELDDFVIRGADGRPTRWFAEVVDDNQMGITQVIRAQEDLPWAHRQAALRTALGFGQPMYAHLPLILGEDGEVLSREVDVRSLRTAGYLPETVAEFLVRLGWDGPTGRLPREELIQQFDVRRVSRTAARVRWDALLAQNAAAMAGAGEEGLVAGLRDCLSLRDTAIRAADDAMLRKLLRLGAAARTFGEIEEKCRALFVDDEQVVYDDRAVKKVLARGDPTGFEMIGIVRGRLAGLASWEAEAIERLIEEIRQETGLTTVRLARGIHVAVTGQASNLPVGLLLEVLGRDKTLRRMDRCVQGRAGAY